MSGRFEALKNFSFAGTFSKESAKAKYYNSSLDVDEPPLAGETGAYFIPFRTALVFPFSYPFGRKTNLRNALLLSFKPVLGERTDKLSLSPQINEQRSDLTSGAAWFVAKEEIAACEEKFGKDAQFIPAPLAFAASVFGNGVVVWEDEESSCAVWFKDYVPRLYRAAPNGGRGSRETVDWMKDYAARAGEDEETMRVRVYRASEVSHDEIRRAAEAVSEASDWLLRLDLSNAGASIAEKHEELFAAASGFIRAATAAGAVLFLLSSAVLLQNGFNADAFSSSPADIYKSATGEESRSPLSSITKQKRALSGGSTQTSLGGVLENFAAAWKEIPEDANVRIDAIRYGAERTEIEGEAPKTEDIGRLRDALDKNGFDAKLGDVRQIRGGGMRFSLSLSEGGRAR